MNTPTFERLSALLKSQGFEEHPHAPHFGYQLPSVYYTCRKTGKLREYVSLSFYLDFNGEFCEGHYEFFYTEKNTYLPKGRNKTSELVKRGFKDLTGALFRTEADLLALVNTTPEQRLAKAEETLATLLKNKE